MVNRDLLKEAIADAKAVKETAIANAKAALEEAFHGPMQKLFAEKIAQLDEAREEEESREERANVDEYEYEEGMKAGEKMQEADDSGIDEIDLEELLRELDEMEGEEELINNPGGAGNLPKSPDMVEEKEEEEEDKDYTDEDADGIKDSDDEEIDIANMDESDLKSFIESVIADMVAAGELEGGEDVESEEDEESEEEVEDYKKMEENYKMEEKPINEVDIVSTMAIASGIIAAVFSMGLVKASTDEKEDIEAEAKRLVKTGKVTAEDAATMAIASVEEKNSNAYGFGTKAAGNAGSAFAESEMEEMKGELNEAYQTIKTIQTELQEVNLFNAKLLYTNKIFKAKTLTESQKVKVLAAFDKAASVKEAKLVFETLSEGFKEKKSPVNESLLRGSASRAAGVADKKPILEVNDQFARWQTLAGIKK